MKAGGASTWRDTNLLTSTTLLWFIKHNGISLLYFSSTIVLVQYFFQFRSRLPCVNQKYTVQGGRAIGMVRYQVQTTCCQDGYQVFWKKKSSNIPGLTLEFSLDNFTEKLFHRSFYRIRITWKLSWVSFYPHIWPGQLLAVLPVMLLCNYTKHSCNKSYAT